MKIEVGWAAVSVGRRRVLLPENRLNFGPLVGCQGLSADGPCLRPHLSIHPSCHARIFPVAMATPLMVIERIVVDVVVAG